MAKAKNDHDLELAREARLQQRRSEAYVELLTMAEEVGNWVSMVKPMFDYGQKAPPLPDAAKQARANALVNAYGSAAAHAFNQAWRRAVDEIHLLATVIQLAEKHARGADVSGKWLELEQLRPKEISARRALADHLSLELNGTKRVTAEAEMLINRSAETGSPESP